MEEVLIKRRNGWWAWIILPSVLLGVLIWRSAEQVDPVPIAVVPAEQDMVPEGYSNVRHSDYVGPKLCAECHDKRYRQWSQNLHRKMNRLASEPGAVLGSFDDVRVRYAKGVLHLTRSKESFFMSFLKEGGVQRRFRITRTIGSRYLQEYVGVQELGPEAANDPVYATEIRLPFGFLFRSGRWLPQQYFDSWHGEEYANDETPARDAFQPDTSPWRARCAWCHNTYAFDKRLARLHGDEQRGNGIETLFQDQAEPNAAIAESNLLPVDELVSVGISCESCHFGAREHAIDEEPIRFMPVNDLVSKSPRAPTLVGTREDARAIVAICAQCHSAPTQLYPNGAGTRNSSEALDLLSGACASRIKCTDCHDPHVPGPGTMAPVQQKHLDACLACHQSLQDPEVAREHTKHSEEVSCLDCHMPRIVQGLSSLLRTHRIDSPSNVAMLESGLNACNFCHLDKGVAWTIAQLNRDYGTQLKSVVGGDRPAALLWLESDKRIHRLTAAGAIGISPLGPLYLPTLLRMLAEPIAYDRLRYVWAIEEVVGRRLKESEYSLTADPQTRRNQVLRLTQELRPIDGKNSSSD